MKRKYMFVASMLFVLMAASILLTNLYIGKERVGMRSDASLEHDFYIVTSFYPMYIAAKNIVGDCDGVRLQNLSEPQTGCMHDYQLTTEDMRVLSSADVFVVNGGGIESFLADTAKQYPELSIIDASAQLKLIDNNAHAWMSISDYMTQVQTITKQLAALDSVHAGDYQKNGKQYIKKLEQLQSSQQAAAEQCANANVLIFHEAFAYVARDYGLHVSGGMDLDEERQISAGEVADLLSQIREQKAGVILAEELYGKQMCEAIKREADVQVIYLDTCVRGEDDADSYLNAMKENISKVQQIRTKSNKE